MFKPEPGDFFHIIHEKLGFVHTVYRCTDNINGDIVGEYVAGIKPTHIGPAMFRKATFTFWPVEPGYIDGSRPKYPKADASFARDFVTRFGKKVNK